MKKTDELIKEVAREIVMLLLKKNKDYGDTANKPPQIFSKLSAKEGILARIDDKLSRIKQVGINDKTEDTILDLIGYLILYKVQCKKENNDLVSDAGTLLFEQARLMEGKMPADPAQFSKIMNQFLLKAIPN